MLGNWKYGFFYNYSIRYLLYVCIICVFSIYGNDTYSVISTAILSYDSILEETVKQLENIDNLNSTDDMLLKVVQAHPEFETIMLINSKGKIISKVEDNKISSRDYRYIGKQSWYRSIELIVKPYYGNIIDSNEFYLFWNQPTFITVSNFRQYTGVVSAKISLESCFKTIAKRHTEKFAIFFQNQIIFSNLGTINTDLYLERNLSVYGFPDLIVKYKNMIPNPQHVISQTSEKPIVTALKEDKNPETKPQIVTSVELKTPGTSRPTEAKILFIIIVISIVVVIMSFYSMTRASNKHKHVIEIITRGMI